VLRACRALKKRSPNTRDSKIAQALGGQFLITQQLPPRCLKFAGTAVLERAEKSASEKLIHHLNVEIFSKGTAAA
jgi:hypothetical protein